MNSNSGLLIVICCIIISACGTRAKIVPAPNQPYVQASTPTNRVCFLRGALPEGVKYEVVGKIIGSKKTYGSTDQVLERMAEEAKKAGADAVIDLDAGQRFGGIMPWDTVRPKGYGIAVRYAQGQKPVDCEKLDGKIF